MVAYPDAGWARRFYDTSSIRAFARGALARGLDRAAHGIAILSKLAWEAPFKDTAVGHISE